MDSPPEDRSSYAVGMAWASRGLTVSIEMVAPGLLGLWLDGQFGTRWWLTIIGFVLGFVFGLWHLLQMVAAPMDNRSRDAQAKDTPPKDLGK